jgi:peroxiredoxin
MSNDVAARGGLILAVSTQDWEDLPGQGAPVSPGMVFLSDAEQRVIGRWDLAHATFGREVARPASFLVGTDGRVLWRELPDDWRHRPSQLDYEGLVDRVLERRSGPPVGASEGWRP